MLVRIVLLLAILLALTAPAGATQEAMPPDSGFEFGEVMQGVHLQHEFALHNVSSTPLRIIGADISTPMRLQRMPAIVPPGGSVSLHVGLDTSRLKGAYEGRIVLRLDTGDEERVFRVAGKVVPPVEILPLPALFVATVKGTASRASVTIVNREPAPLDVALAGTSAMGAVNLETLEPGRRYRLSIEVPADAPAGRRSERIELRTSSTRVPRVLVAANVLVHERVHAFPEEVDIGAFTRRELRAAGTPPNALSQTLMVYQAGGRDFSAAPHADPGLVAQYERGRTGDRVQLTVSLPPDTPPGPIDRLLLVETNDPDFPILRIPVRGRVLPD